MYKRHVWPKAISVMGWMDSRMWPRQSCKNPWRRWTIITHGGNAWACLAKRKMKVDLLVTNLWNHDYSSFLSVLLAQWYNCTHLSKALAFTRAATGAAELRISVFQCGRSYNRSCHNYPSHSFPRLFFSFFFFKNKKIAWVKETETVSAFSHFQKSRNLMVKIHIL